MKHIQIILVLLITAVFASQAKPLFSAEQQLQFYQELRTENYITEQEFQLKSRQLKSQIKSSRSTTKGVGNSEISGQVFNAAVGLNNIQVTLYDADTRAFIDSTNTDATGFYSFTGLVAGNYYVTVLNNTDDYIDAIWSSTGTQYCNYCQVPPQAVIALAANAVSANHDLNLTVGAILTGQMIDSVTSDPVETLSVALVKPSDPTFNWNVFTQFDGMGNYTIRGIPEGTYQVYLRANYDVNLHIPEVYNDIQCNLCGSLAYDGAGTAVNLSNGFTQSGIDFILEEGASISGFLVDNITLGPLDDLGLVMVFNETNQLIFSQIVNGTIQDPGTTGAYTVGGLLPGTYFAQGGDLGRDFYVREIYETQPCPWSGCNRGAGGTPINLGHQEQRLGINFTLDYGGKISGNITDFTSGLPLNDPNLIQYVQFYDSDGEVAGGAIADYITGEYTSARAIKPGTYSARTGSMFNGQFIADYVMQKYMPGGNIDCPGVTCDLTAGNIVVNLYDPNSGTADPEADATTSGIDFALSTGFSFSGTINDLGTASPLENVHVLVYDDTGEFAHWATTDINGDFTVSGLPAGTYYAKTNNGSNLPFMGLNLNVTGAWVDILYDGLNCPGSTCDVTTGTPIVLGGSPDAGPKGVPQYIFNLPEGGTFTGRLIHSDTTAGLANINVNVYNSQGEFYGGYESDIDGYWMTSGFPADTYYLLTEGRGGMVDVKFGGDYCFNGQCDPLSADPIVLGGNYNISGLNMVLKPDFIFKSNMD